MENWTEYSRFFTALLVIMSPFAALPIFLSLTRSYSQQEKHRIAFTASITVFAVLIIVAFMGETLLTGLGTSLASFRVGGGIVLLLMALAMLMGQTSSVRTTEEETIAAEQKQTIAVVPLAIPLLAGPGAISTVIIEMHRSSGVYHAILVVTCILIACFILWLVLKLAEPIGKLLGPIGLNIINRLFGLILTAIAIEIMANGLKQLFPILGSA